MIASAYKLPLAAVATLLQDIRKGPVGQEITDCPVAGYAVVMALVFLEEQGIDLSASAYKEVAEKLSKQQDGTYYVLLTPDQRRQHLSAIAFGSWTADELQQYSIDFNERDDEGMGEAMLAAIRYLAQVLAAMDNDSVVLLEVG